MARTVAVNSKLKHSKLEFELPVSGIDQAVQL